LRESLAQFGQRVAAEKAAEEQTVGLQGPADLDQRAGQVVDGVEREERDGEIEALAREGQRFLVANDREFRRVLGTRREAHNRSGAPARPQPLGHGRRGRANVEGRGKRAQHRGEPIGEVVHRVPEEKVGVAGHPGPGEAASDEGAIEDARDGHGRAIPARRTRAPLPFCGESWGDYDASPLRGTRERLSCGVKPASAPRVASLACESFAGRMPSCAVWCGGMWLPSRASASRFMASAFSALAFSSAVASALRRERGLSQSSSDDSGMADLLIVSGATRRARP
jgi:hypothetical protein